MSGCDHVFRHRDNYCIRCDRRIAGHGEPHRAPSPSSRVADEEFVATPVIDTSHTQDDYYDDAGLRGASAPSSLTENALREVLS